jgi:putative DNA primase/helicase
MAAADDLARKLKRDQEFDDLARIALEAAPVLLFELIGGRKQGHEWVGARTAKGGVGDSWSINLKSGVWRHFAGTEQGTDIISLFAEILHVTMGAAAEDIRQRLGLSSGAPLPRNTLPYQPPEEPEADCDPIPYDAGPLKPHPAHGEPSHVHVYGHFMVVQRWDLPSGKAFSPWTWRAGGWVNKAWPTPRPLYHLEYLAQYPEVTVMVVEGEKCVDRAAAVLKDYVVVSWYGGSQAWRLTDWEPLRGRAVLLWPDADEPGRKAAAQIAAHLHSIAASVRVVNPNGAADGWDVGDAVEEGWKEPRIREFIGVHVAAPIAPQAVTDEGNPRNLFKSAREPYTRVIEPDAVSTIMQWREMRLALAGNGIPHTNVANGSAILQRHPNFSGQIWFDDFCGEVYHTLRGVAQPWTDLDTRRVTVFAQEALEMPKISIGVMHEAVMHAAECHIRNPVIEYLDSLEWDGIDRLQTWVSDFLGVQLDDYSIATGRNWLIGLVARAYRPGVKMDNMPVLEGLSGLNKTQFLEALGGEWYKALPMEFGSKDFKQSLRGAWVVEIPDMTGFGHVAHSQIIAELSIPIDIYRASYGRRSAKYPRTCVFTATSETNDYLSESRGKRRYWPLRCTDIALDSFRLSRDRLFAEAVHAYRLGEHWYDMPASAADEQLLRTTSDPWTPYVLDTAAELWDQYRRGIGSEVTTEMILLKGIEKRVSDMTQSDKIRVARILKANGYDADRTSLKRFWFKLEPRQLT